MHLSSPYSITTSKLHHHTTDNLWRFGFQIWFFTLNSNKSSLCITKYYAMKAYGTVKVWLQVFLTIWRWMLSFILRPLYSRGRSPWYPLDRRLGGPQRRSVANEIHICGPCLFFKSWNI